MTSSAAKPYSPTREKVEAIVSRIATQFAPSRVIIFGSYARNAFGPESDIDVLVVVDDTGDKRELAAAIGAALADIIVSKDIIVATEREIEGLNGASGTTILERALKSGLTLYERGG